jgi:hypothetical protein
MISIKINNISNIYYINVTKLYELNNFIVSFIKSMKLKMIRNI